MTLLQRMLAASGLDTSGGERFGYMHIHAKLGDDVWCMGCGKRIAINVEPSNWPVWVLCSLECEERYT